MLAFSVELEANMKEVS